MINAIKSLYHILTDKTIDHLVIEHEKQKKEIDDFLRQYDPYLNRYCSISHDKCTSCGIMTWKKDDEHRYIDANFQHLETFFDLQPNQKIKILGKTDAELIIQWRIDNPHTNFTFGEMCVSTDDYVKNKGEACRFFEFGYKYDKPLLLDVFKKPVYDGDDFVGTEGNAFDCSDRESDMYDLLQYYMTTESAVRLGDTHSKRVAAYFIKDRQRNFKGGFPE